MVKLGFSNDIIISKINSSTCNFDTSIDSLKALKEMGVNNDIIIAMINHAPANNNKITTQTDRASITKTGMNLSKYYLLFFRLPN